MFNLKNLKIPIYKYKYTYKKLYMQKDNLNDDLQISVWQDAFDDFNMQEAPQTNNLFQYRYKDIVSDKQNEEKIQCQQEKKTSQNQLFLSNSQGLNQMQQLENQHKSSKSQYLKKNHLKNQKNHQTSEKQKYYSKSYRQKVKQRYKNLQQQNTDLKKRIFELQSKLREQQIQLSRLKFPAPEKQLSIQQLNKQFADISINYLNELKENPGEYDRRWFSSENNYHKYFVDFYNERGFAGQKKLKIMNYHFNEILEIALKDHQKYLAIMLPSSQNCEKLASMPEFQIINKVYIEIFKSDPDVWHRLKEFVKNLMPMNLQLNTLISEFCKKYEQILQCSHKLHNYIRNGYQNNMDIGRRRLEMQAWFESHKYTKVMSKLRHQWFEWMKSLAQKKEQQNKEKKKGIKRTKNFQ